MRTPTRKHLAVLLAAAVLAAIAAVSGEPEPPFAAAHDTTPAGMSECTYHGLVVGTSIGVYQCYRDVNRHYEVVTTYSEGAAGPGPGVTCDTRGRCWRNSTASCAVYGLAPPVCSTPAGSSYVGSVSDGPYWHPEIDRATVGCAAGRHRDVFDICHMHLRSTPPQSFYDAGCGLWGPHLHAQPSSPVRGGNVSPPTPSHSSVDLGPCGPVNPTTTRRPTSTTTTTTTVPGTLPELSVAGETVDEGDGAADFTITLSSAAASAVTVAVATSDGTATIGDNDYAAVNRMVTIPVGSQTAVVSVTVLDDTISEADEMFTLRLSNPSGADLSTNSTATVTIRANDAPPPCPSGQIRLAQHVDSATNDDGCRPIDCSPQTRLPNGLCAPPLGSPQNVTGACISSQITLSWKAPATGTASRYRYGIYSDRYLVNRVTVGHTPQTNVIVDVSDTTITYYAEVQARNTREDSGYRETGGFTCTQPPPPVVSLNATNLSVGETSSVQVFASLSTAPPGAASVRFTTSGATDGGGSCSTPGADFYVSDTEFTFTSPTTSASVTLYTCDDDDTDDETVTVSLTTTGINGLRLGSPTSVVVTINDDDDDDGYGL